jgi:hypothetical protein
MTLEVVSMYSSCPTLKKINREVQHAVAENVEKLLLQIRLITLEANIGAMSMEALLIYHRIPADSKHYIPKLIKVCVVHRGMFTGKLREQFVSLHQTTGKVRFPPAI